MTLQQWCELVGAIKRMYGNSVFVDIGLCRQDEANISRLWHLSDYKVSSRSGDIVRLVPV